MAPPGLRSAAGREGRPWREGDIDCQPTTDDWSGCGSDRWESGTGVIAEHGHRVGDHSDQTFDLLVDRLQVRSCDRGGLDLHEPGEYPERPHGADQTILDIGEGATLGSEPHPGVS